MTEGEVPQAPSRGMRLATCSLTKSAFGPLTCPGLDPRLEKTQNWVSTKVPDVIESLRAPCKGIGIAMAGVVASTVPELSIWDLRRF